MCIQEQINMIQCVREDTANHWWLQYYIETMAVPRCPKASETLSTANASVFSTFILKEVEEAGVQIAQYFLPLWRIIRSQIQAKYSSAKSFVVKKKISDSRVGHDVRWDSSSCNDKQLWKTSWLIVDRRPEQNKSDVASIVSGRFHVQPIVIKLIWFEKERVAGNPICRVQDWKLLWGQSSIQNQANSCHSCSHVLLRKAASFPKGVSLCNLWQFLEACWFFLITYSTLFPHWSSQWVKNSTILRNSREGS